MTREIYTDRFDDEYLQHLMLFLAKELSGSFASIGFIPNKKGLILQKNSREDILLKIAEIFSNIEFLNEKEAVVLGKMSVTEAKRGLNLVAAFLSGSYSIAGPLSFVFRKHNEKDLKIIKINSGVVSLRELRLLFSTVSRRAQGAFVEKKNIAVAVPVNGDCEKLIVQEA